MDNIIELTCPACGGKILLGKKREKIYCTSCGTHLHLQQGADGLLTPEKAGGPGNPAQSNETQNALVVIEVLKPIIQDLEKQACKVRKALFIHYNRLQKRHFVNPANAIIAKYEKSLGIDKKAGWLGHWKTTGHNEITTKVLSVDIPGFNTPEELYNLHQFVIGHEDQDKDTSLLAAFLKPIARIWPELKDKKEKYQKALDTIG